MMKKKVNLFLSPLSMTICFILSFIISPSAYSLPQQILPPGEKMVLVSPIEHRWGAYDASGRLLRSGLASAGANWCPDVGRECHTWVGQFRVQSLGSSNCVSPSFPIPKGGAPMPYCMYFNKYQALHGSYEVANANISHGCIRMRVADAKWLRFNFVELGTLVVIQPYQ